MINPSVTLVVHDMKSPAQPGAHDEALLTYDLKVQVMPAIYLRNISNQKTKS
jgi:hypothetical protein